MEDYYIDFDEEGLLEMLKAKSMLAEMWPDMFVEDDAVDIGAIFDNVDIDVLVGTITVSDVAELIETEIKSPTICEWNKSTRRLIKIASKKPPTTTRSGRVVKAPRKFA